MDEPVPPVEVFAAIIERQRALSRLPTGQRYLLWEALRARGYSLSEIAMATGVSRERIRVILRRREERICAYRHCDKPVLGRSDKRFCSESCRNKEAVYRGREKATARSAALPSHPSGTTAR